MWLLWFPVLGLTCATAAANVACRAVCHGYAGNLHQGCLCAARPVWCVVVRLASHSRLQLVRYMPHRVSHSVQLTCVSWVLPAHRCFKTFKTLTPCAFGIGWVIINFIKTLLLISAVFFGTLCHCVTWLCNELASTILLLPMGL